MIGAQDNLEQRGSNDTLITDTESDSLLLPNFQDTDSTKAQKKVKVIKRKYSFKNQLRSAIGMMFFVTIILMSVQNLNP